MDEISLHGGGCALNTATGLARFGLSVLVVGKVGEDTFGNFVVGLLDERGLDTRGVLRDPAVPTSATVVLVDRAGERSFLHLPGANGALGAEELAPEIFAGRALHVAGALVMPALDGAPTAGLLAEAQRRGVRTSLDTVYDATGRWERLQPCLPHLDLLMASLAEAQGISGEHKPANAAAWFRDRGVAEVALKLGPDGCYVASAEFEGDSTRVSRVRRRRHRGRRRFRRRGHLRETRGLATPRRRTARQRRRCARDDCSRRDRGSSRPQGDTGLRGHRGGRVNARLNRLFAADGRCFDVAVDHGFFGEGAFLAGIETMEWAVLTLVEAGPDAIQLSPGEAPYLQRVQGPQKPALVLRTDVANVYGVRQPRHLFSELVAGAVEQALRLDAACVVCNLLQLRISPSCSINVFGTFRCCARPATPLACH